MFTHLHIFQYNLYTWITSLYNNHIWSKLPIQIQFLHHNLYNWCKYLSFITAILIHSTLIIRQEHHLPMTLGPSIFRNNTQDLYIITIIINNSKYCIQDPNNHTYKTAAHNLQTISILRNSKQYKRDNLKRIYKM